MGNTNKAPNSWDSSRKLPDSWGDAGASLPSRQGYAADSGKPPERWGSRGLPENWGKAGNVPPRGNNAVSSVPNFRIANTAGKAAAGKAAASKAQIADIAKGGAAKFGGFAKRVGEMTKNAADGVSEHLESDDTKQKMNAAKGKALSFANNAGNAFSGLKDKTGGFIKRGKNDAESGDSDITSGAENDAVTEEYFRSSGNDIESTYPEPDSGTFVAPEQDTDNDTQDNAYTYSNSASGHDDSAKAPFPNYKRPASVPRSSSTVRKSPDTAAPSHRFLDDEAFERQVNQDDSSRGNFFNKKTALAAVFILIVIGGFIGFSSIHNYRSKWGGKNNNTSDNAAVPQSESTEAEIEQVTTLPQYEEQSITYRTAATQVSAVRTSAVTTQTDLKDKYTVYDVSAAGSDFTFVSKTESKVNTESDDLNLRATPSMNGDVIVRMPRGATVYEYGHNSSWSYLSYSVGGKTYYGYASKQYIKDVNEKVEVTPCNKKGVIDASKGEVSSFESSYVVQGGTPKLVRKSLGNGWHVTAVNTCKAKDITWYELYDSDDNDYYGWVDASFIDFSKTSASSSSKDEYTDKSNLIATGKVTISSGVLNVRSSPSTDSKILTTIPKGNYVGIISKSGDWYYVKYYADTSSPIYYGYVSSEYIEIYETF